MTTSHDIYPDFLITPYQLIADPQITPVDERVYGIVYWFRKMKLEKCTASNETIAKLAKTSAKVVQASILRMEKKGYVLRTFRDDARKIRDEIIPLIAFGQVPSGSGRVPSPDGTRVPSTDGQIENNTNEKSYVDSPATPADPVYSDPNFITFWDLYPKKEGKGSAWSSWKKIKPSKALSEKIIASVRDHIEHHDNWRKDPKTGKPRDGGRFIPNPATFLNQRRFDDEITSSKEPSRASKYDGVKVTKA